MSIDTFAPGLLSSRTTGRMFVSLRSQLEDLQRQLATGKKADSYGALGFDRRISLDFRGRLAAIESYQDNVQTGTLRLSLMNLSLENINKLAGDARAYTLPGGFTPGTDGLTIAQRQAREGLKQMIDLLNTDVAGHYLFSGRATDTKPVEDFDLIINGDTSRAGLTQLIDERTQADLGANGLGRLDLTSAANNVQLTEQVAGLPFGFKIAGASADGGNIAAVYTAGPPANASFTVATQPADGDKVRVALTLPDGTQQTIELVARTTINPALAENAFAIGANPNATAANLAAAVQTAVGEAAATTLAAASAQVAAGDFFAGSLSSPPLRVNGPPFDTATTTIAGTAANTVIWYKGDDTAPVPRNTSLVKVDTSQTVGIGAQANEDAFQTMFAQFGILAAQTFNAADPNAHDRYEANASRIRTALSFSGNTQSVENIATELALANTSINAANGRLKTTAALLNDSIDSVENASNEEVAAAILALQTRLQASYQTTSIISSLSLARFI